MAAVLVFAAVPATCLAEGCREKCHGDCRSTAFSRRQIVLSGDEQPDTCGSHHDDDIGATDCPASGIERVAGGPSQVAARLLETLFARNAHPIISNLASTIMVAIGLGLVLWFPGCAAVGIVLYGIGSGIRSVVRATLPLALFGQAQYPVVLGRIARPTLIAQALTPLVGGYVQAHFGAPATMIVLVLLSVINIVLVVLLKIEINT
jgi:hypothetical protein